MARNILTVAVLQRCLLLLALLFAPQAHLPEVRPSSLRLQGLRACGQLYYYRYTSCATLVLLVVTSRVAYTSLASLLCEKAEAVLMISTMTCKTTKTPGELHQL
jgi:hypothetical protein